MIDNQELAKMAFDVCEARRGHYSQGDLVEVALRARRAMNDKSLVMRTLEAVPIYCRIVDIHFEEKSQRFVVSYCPLTNNSDGEIEQVRTDRVDGRDGELVHKLWSREMIGKTATIFKLNERADAKHSSGYRTAPWVQVYQNN